jgi:hypothetical protein
MKRLLMTVSLLLNGSFILYASGEAPYERTDPNQQAPITTDMLNQLALAVQEGNNFEEARQAAQAGIQSIDPDIQCSALEVFFALVKQGQAFQEATAAAQFGMNNQNTQSFALTLFSELVQKEHAFPEAITAAQVVQQNKNVLVQHDALILFKDLITQGQGLQEIISNTKSILLTPNISDNIRYEARRLSTLAQKKQSESLTRSFSVGTVPLVS